MTSIAIERMGVWFTEAGTEFKKLFTPLLAFGAIAFGLEFVKGALMAPIAFLGQIIALIPGVNAPVMIGVGSVAFLLTVVVAACVSGAKELVLVIAGFETLSRGTADFNALKLGWRRYGVAIACMVLGNVIQGLLLLILSIPGILVIIGAASSERYPIIALGGLLLLLAILLVGLLVTPLFMFAIPVMVHRNLGPWDSILESVRIVRSDLIGLALFSLVVNVLAGVVACTQVGVFLLGPFFGVLTVRSYLEYAGKAAVPAAV